MPGRPPAALLPAAALAGAAALHVLWGLGSSFPADDPAALADAVAGTQEVPPPGACFAVAVALTAGAALVAGVGGQHPLARWGRRGVAATLGARGLAGLTGLTRLLVPWTPSPHFQDLDRRRYGPLCLALSAAILVTRASGAAR